MRSGEDLTEIAVANLLSQAIHADVRTGVLLFAFDAMSGTFFETSQHFLIRCQLVVVWLFIICRLPIVRLLAGQSLTRLLIVRDAVLPAISLLAAAPAAFVKLFITSRRVAAFIRITIIRISLWALIGGKFIAAASVRVLIAVLVRVLIVAIGGIFIIAPVIVVLLVVAACRVLLVAFVGRAPILWAFARAALVPVGTAVVGLATIRLAELVN